MGLYCWCILFGLGDETPHQIVPTQSKLKLKVSFVGTLKASAKRQHEQEDTRRRTTVIVPHIISENPC